jgi:hypothetical protein
MVYVRIKANANSATENLVVEVAAAATTPSAIPTMRAKPPDFK